MKNRLVIIEGLPCSGKRTLSACAAALLQKKTKVLFVDEGTGDHPADYEFHALAPAGLLSEESCIVPLGSYSGELFEKLLPHKIYDGLPWETEKPLMLAKWQQFVAEAQPDTTYVFNCVLLQNPMCETMMRFGYPEAVSAAHIGEIVSIAEAMKPVVIYLQNSQVADSVRKAAPERPGWLEAVIDYHVNGAYGRSIAASGFDGYIRCLEERQAREMRILEQLPLKKLILMDPQTDWASAKEQLGAFLNRLA